MPIQFKLTEKAKELKAKGIDVTPRRMQKGDAGQDLSACIDEELLIYPGEVVKIPTGVCVWLGDDLLPQTEGNMTYAGLYLPRSSNQGLVLTNTVGLLDSAYQHESFCKWRNTSDDLVKIRPGDRMAQLVIFPAFIVDWLEVEEFEEITGRGKGDGSSGK